jgi:hypothetical protein
LSDVLAGYSGIDLATPRELIGDGLTSRCCIGVNDPLMVQTLVLEDDVNRVAVITLDLIGIDFEEDDCIRRRIASLGFRAENVLIAASHTHSGPPAIDFGYVRKSEEFVTELVDKTEQSVTQAVQSLSPATFRIGVTEFPHSVNRRQSSWLGRTKLGVNPNGPVDHQLSHILLETVRGKVLLLCYGCHPVINKKIPLASADYVSGIRAFAASAGIASMFLNGALGDATPYDRDTKLRLGDAGPKVALEFGRRMGYQALASSSTCRDESDPQIGCVSTIREVRLLRRSWLNRVQFNRRLLLQALKVGQIVFVTFPGEIFAQTGLELRSRPNGNIATVSCANGYIGYVPPRSEYSRGGYEINSSYVFGYRVPIGTAEDLQDEAERLISKTVEN